VSAGDLPRVVSLVPSATETLLAWGVAPVAVTKFCEHPELPHVGGTKNPDVAAIVAMAPDLVVMCHEENRAEDAVALRGAGLTVHDVAPGSVGEVGRALAALATALGIRVEPIDGPPLLPALGCTAFVPIWRRPWMTCNASTYGSSVLDAIGVANVFGGDGLGEPGDAARYPTVTLAEVAARRPDLVLAPSEPYSWKPPHLDELRRVAPVLEVDGQDLFWWGVRTPAAVRRLHAAVAAHLDA
jgi:ABC-type Fe3+-hydroxamate transport system substrate-binding protein